MAVDGIRGHSESESFTKYVRHMYEFQNFKFRPPCVGCALEAEPWQRSGLLFHQSLTLVGAEVLEGHSSKVAQEGRFIQEGPSANRISSFLVIHAPYTHARALILRTYSLEFNYSSIYL